jgi:hypothetical protein
MNTRIRDLKATVKRLEAIAGKGQKHCAHCRLYKRHRWPDPQERKARPGVLVKHRCDFCGFELNVSLADIPQDERDAFRLYFSFALEDFYTNPKAAALYRWVRLRPKRKKGGGQACGAQGRKGQE